MTTFSFLLFVVIVSAALWIDLHAHSKDEAITIRNASIWSAFWIGLALLFAGYIDVVLEPGTASLFLTAYVLEKSLSVDNLFAFMAVFLSFGITDKYQHRILYYGIIGAILTRLIFISFGVGSLMVLGKIGLLIIAGFVLWSAYKLWQQRNAENEEDRVDYTDHWAVKFAQKFFPVHTTREDHDFFKRINGVLFCTPMFLCLVMIEVADIMFAFDSVPAVLAVSQKMFVVYTSNIFAILGLRSLYFLLCALKKTLVYLNDAVVFVLGYVGLKLLADVSGIVHIPPMVSLVITLGVLGGGILLSLIYPKNTQSCEV